MTSPIFSIIIPTYNRAQQLQRAIDSVLNQTFESFEIVIVDDGSTDNTEEKVTAYHNEKIRYYKKKNEERSIARNYGIQLAQGRYINFLDSDDCFYPHHLTTAYRLLSQHDFPEVGHLGYELISNTNEVILRRNNLDHKIAERLIYENILHGNAIFIRSDTALQYSFIPSPEAIISEDWYLWLRLAARYPIYFDNTITSAIIEHKERSLKNIDPDKLIASTEVIIKYLKRDTAFINKYGRLTAYHFANHYTLVTLVLSIAGNRKRETLKYLVKAFHYDWTVIFRKRFLASVKHCL